MNIIKDTILCRIYENNVVFVFHTEILASLWAKKSLDMCDIGSIPLKRFIAWDTFKECTFKERISAKERKPVSTLIRTLFIQKLLSNSGTISAAKGKKVQKSLFPSLIPDEFVDSSSVFVNWFVRLLPQLHALKQKNDAYMQKNAVLIDLYPEITDLLVLEKMYTSFLSAHRLFEPSWEKTDMIENENEYYIFFPHILEDFSEYADILHKSDRVHIIHEDCDSLRLKPPMPVTTYTVVREELKSLALSIYRLHYEKNVAFTDIAVTVPNIETVEPYILREFSLHCIPVQYRSGKPLANYSAGRLFSLINDCVSHNFSFVSLKALLLNTQFPWKNYALCEQLIEFGIKNNCVSSYMHNGVPVDVWEETFKIKSLGGAEELLRRFYVSLKKTITGICASSSFADLQRKYFAFRHESQFFDDEQFSDEANAVLGRCIEELSSLITIEEEYPDIKSDHPFAFFLSLLQDKKYVPQALELGVSIFPYRAAAGAPFAHHFIIDASQESLTILYRPLDFLRQDARSALQFSDINVSDSFIRIYQLDEDAGRSVHFSCSDKNFSGYTSAHGFFLKNTLKAPPVQKDFFDEEKEWFLHPTEDIHALFSIQKKGYEMWVNSAGENEKECVKSREKNPASVIGERLKKVQYADSLIRVSATDLNAFFECRTKWFYQKILRIRDVSLEAKLMDDKNLGTVYHEILRRVFERIQAADTVFVSAHREQYTQWILEYAKEVAYNSPVFADPVARLLLHGQINAIADNVSSLLSLESTYFDSYGVQWLEKKIELKEGNKRLEGVLDRISITSGDDAVLIDYKINWMPLKSDCIEYVMPDGISELHNFQIALYAYMYEKSTGEKICQAAFVSILKKDIMPIIGTMKPKQASCTPEEFERTITVLQTYISEFSERISNEDFSIPENITYENCAACEYKTICRTTFTVDGFSPRGDPYERCDA